MTTRTSIEIHLLGRLLGICLAVGLAGSVLLAQPVVPGELDPELAPAPEPQEAPKPDPAKTAAFAAALKDAISGKLSIEKVQIAGRVEGTEFVLYGRGVGFVNSTQVSFTKDQMVAILKRFQKADFANMADGFGGVKRGRLGPMIADRLVRSLEIQIGSQAKGSEQLAGGTQSKELEDLVNAVLADIKPLEEKGVKLADLTLADALAKVAKGEIAHEAATITMTDTLRDPKENNKTWIFQLNAGSLEITGKKVELSPAQARQLVCRLAEALAKQDLAKFPIQLYAPKSLVSLDIRVRGAKAGLNMTADLFPHNKEMMAQNPEAQKAFEQVYKLISETYQQFAATQPVTAPIGK